MLNGDEERLIKIAIIGYSGAGKSTLAKRLGEFYHCPVLHLDKINFIENWVVRDLEQALIMVKEFMKNDTWIIEGNYSAFLQEQRLEQADKIVFMDFPRWRCLWQAYSRYWKNRNRSREDMADGCIEKFDSEFLKWILWVGRSSKIKAHHRKIIQKYPDKTIVVKNRKEIMSFLENLQNEKG